ncbi:MAG: hypothetical protein QOE59_4464, partial [Actinomycetota bacterium]|nr:hypothetical protein [Actinomycetota bacterium]
AVFPTGWIGRPARVTGPAGPGPAGPGLAPSWAVTTAAPTAPATPIFDEVDRWWRDGGDEPVPATMLSFAGTPSRSLRPATLAGTSGSRHQLVPPT